MSPQREQGAGTQPLAGSPASTLGVSGFEVELRQLVGGGRDLTLHTRDEAVDVCPLVASAGHFERPSTNELESGAQRRHGVSRRLTLRPAYALDQPLNLKSGATKAELEKAMQNHIVAEAQLIGRFGR